MKVNARARKNAVKKKGVSTGLKGYAKVALIAIPAVMLVGALSFIIWSAINSSFQLKSTVFSGNAHLTDDEIRALAGIKGDENLLKLSSGSLYWKLMQSPWIKSVVVRKEFPDGLHILIKEAEPFALLDLKGRMFLVDENGRMLEELKDSPIPFLPIISSDPYNEKEVFSEAVKLAGAIKEKGLLARKDHMEIIAHKPQELAMNMDGLVVKVGSGEYGTKIVRLMELEDEIKQRQIPVDYIDLRFANKVVVKPISGGAR